MCSTKSTTTRELGSLNSQLSTSSAGDGLTISHPPPAADGIGRGQLSVTSELRARRLSVSGRAKYGKLPMEVAGGVEMDLDVWVRGNLQWEASFASSGGKLAAVAVCDDDGGASLLYARYVPEPSVTRS